MSLARGIQERWQMSQPLCDAVPIERVVTGLAMGPMELPYVTLSRDRDTAVTRTSSGNQLRAARLVLTVWHGELDAALTIAETIEGAFRCAAFAYPGGRVLDSRLESRDEQPQVDGMWRVALDFTMTLDEYEEP